MTEQEALKYMKLFREDWDRDSKTKNAMALDVSIKALEKQIAKKPFDCDDREVWYLCPACKGDLTKIRSFYCGFCGQKLDWGNEDAE